MEILEGGGCGMYLRGGIAIIMIELILMLMGNIVMFVLKLSDCDENKLSCCEK